jgi:hypothetical protein
MAFHWTVQRVDQLERAIRDGSRVAVNRRGTEYLVIALRMAAFGSATRLSAATP